MSSYSTSQAAMYLHPEHPLCPLKGLPEELTGVLCFTFIVLSFIPNLTVGVIFVFTRSSIQNCQCAGDLYLSCPWPPLCVCCQYMILLYFVKLFPSWPSSVWVCFSSTVCPPLLHVAIMRHRKLFFDLPMYIYKQTKGLSVIFSNRNRIHHLSLWVTNEKCCFCFSQLST